MKKAIAFLVICAMAICLSSTAFAAEKAGANSEEQMTITMTAPDGKTTQHVIDIADCARVETDANGNIVPQTRGTTPLSRHTVGQGSTMTYSAPGGAAFYIASGTYVTFSLNLSAVGAYRMGCKNSSGAQTQQYSGSSSQTPSFSTAISSTGNYTFYFSNFSGAAVTVNAGSITF